MRSMTLVVGLAFCGAVIGLTACGDDSGGGAGTDSGTDTDTDTDTDIFCANDAPCTGFGLICNESWGICVVPSCQSHGDFTACEVVTSPDRSYDICQNMACVSPGCGDTTCNMRGPHFPLPDTGQRLCYDETATTTCQASGTYYGQDAQFGWDTSHAATERFTRDLSLSGQPVVTDNVTGLTWQGCAYGLTGGDCTGGSATAAPWFTQVANCDGLSWGGYTDWRLPDRYELQSIVDYGRYLPSIDPIAFPATPSDTFWSSSSIGESYAWSVFFGNGAVFDFSEDNDKTCNNYARCLRGGTVPQPAHFTRDTSTADQPTVLDNRTGLEWQGNASATSSWKDALSGCKGLDWGGDTDWRLPSVDELSSIVDDRQYDPSIDPTAFPDTPSNAFWSSSSYAGYVSSAWSVHFREGSADGLEKPSSYSGGEWDNYILVRCVRSGQWD